jgi:hypothetical protein
LLKFKENYANLLNQTYLLSKYGCENCIKWVKCLNIFSFVAEYLE